MESNRLLGWRIYIWILGLSKGLQSPRQSNTAYNSAVFSFSGKDRKVRESQKRIPIRFPVMNSKFCDTQIHNLMTSESRCGRKSPHPKPKAIFTVGVLGGSVRVPNCKIQN